MNNQDSASANVTATTTTFEPVKHNAKLDARIAELRAQGVSAHIPASLSIPVSCIFRALKDYDNPIGSQVVFEDRAQTVVMRAILDHVAEMAKPRTFEARP